MSGSSGASTGDEGPGTDTTLDPNGSATNGSGEVSGTGSMCTTGCGDGGSPVFADAGSPALDAGDDVLVPEPACASGEATGPRGRCYVAVAALLSWDDARINCQRRGAGWDLASIRSGADSAFIPSLVSNEVWLGGSDAVTEATWAWISDGFAFWQGEGGAGSALNGAFVNWFVDEPNGQDGSDCLRLLVDGSWADLECTESRGALCEGPPR